MTDASNGLPLRQMIEEFYSKQGLPVREPARLIEDVREVAQIRELFQEEAQELFDAIDSGNLLKIADGLADVVYVAYGMAAQYGIDLDLAIKAVHDSNLTKSPHSNSTLMKAHQKVERGDGYVPPDIAPSLQLPAEKPE